jgi:thiol-disulfide isomerase/thioredoxin
MLAEGAVAPELNIGDWSLAGALKNGPVLLVFFKMSCPTCQLTFPFLERLSGKAQVLAISQDGRTGTDQFLSHFHITLPTALDPAPYPASNLYAIRNVPTLYLIEPDGTISLAITGFSKAHIEKLGERFGVKLIRTGEDVPPFRPG